MSDYVFAVIIIAGAIAYGVIGVLIVRSILHGRVRGGHNEVMVTLFAQGGVIYAILLGLIVAAAWTNFSSTSTTVTQEASALVPLYRQTTNMDQDKRDMMRGLLRDYATQVVQDEWPTMAASGKPSPKAIQTIGSIFNTFGTLTPSTKIKEIGDAEFLRTFSDELVLRNQRLAAASSSLSPIMWVGVIVGAIVTISMGFFLYMEVAWPHMLMSGTMAGMVGLLIFILYVLSNPFSGPLAIDASPFSNSLDTFKTIDQQA